MRLMSSAVIIIYYRPTEMTKGPNNIRTLSSSLAAIHTLTIKKSINLNFPKKKPFIEFF